MALVAIDWVVYRLNNASLVPGISFGYDVYDDCGVERYSIYSALNAIDYYYPEELTTCTGNSSKYFLGILGPSRSHTTQQVLSNLDNTDVPVLSPFATFPDLRDYRNFLRTIPSDDDQVEVFVHLMLEHGWNYVVGMHTTDNYGKNGMDKIVNISKHHNICVKVLPGFSITESFDDSAFRENIFQTLLDNIDNTTDGTLAVLYFGQRNVIQHFLSKMQLTADIKPKLKNIRWILSETIGTRVNILSNANDVTNRAMTVSMASLDIPALLLHLNQLLSSNLPQDDISLLIKSHGAVSDDDWKDYITPVVDGTFAIALSLKTAFDVKCKGYQVICVGFKSYFDTHRLESIYSTVINYTELGYNVSPTEFIGRDRIVQFNSSTGDLILDSKTSLYDIYMYENSQLRKVGEFVEGNVKLNSAFPVSFSTSLCQKGCEQCVDKPEIPYEFIEGDVYIIGFFSLHRSSEDPFGCGVFRNLTYDVLCVEAFLNSIHEAYSETGIRFGGIAFDDCYSPSRATMIITDLLTGKLIVPPNNPIKPSKIVGVIGPFPSGVTVPVTFIFSSVSLPSISYASTSPDLDDKEINFPYFYRTVPSDVDQAQAMVEILKEMSWHSVGLVYVSNNYGSKGKDAFKSLANSSGICIESEIEVKEENNSKWNNEAYIALEAVQDSGTNLFIYFGTEGRMMDILSHIRERTNNQHKPYIFIGSDDWADSRNIKNTFGDIVERSLTFKIKTRSTQTNFVQNIVQKASSVDTAGYWYREFFKNYFKCHFQDDFVKTFPDVCRTNTSLTDVSGIMADGRVSHCILAVKALTKGIAETKQQLCHDVDEFPCTIYKLRTDVVRDNIADVTLLDDNQISFRVFDKNRNGDVGFQILQIRRENDGYVYSEVGSYDNDNLVLKSSDISSIVANRLYVSKCTGSFQSSTPALVSSEEEKFRKAEIIIIALLGSLCVVLIIVIVAVVFCFWRRFTGLQKMVEDTKARITYYNEVGTAKRQKQKQHTKKKNGDLIFDQLFPNGGFPSEPPGQHYLPLHDSDPTRSNHSYNGGVANILNQTVPKVVSSSQQSLTNAVRPDLPPRNMPEKKLITKSDSDIHNSYPMIRPKNFAMINQPRMGTAMQTTPTDSLHSQGSIFYARNHNPSNHEVDDQHTADSQQEYLDDDPFKSQPSSPKPATANLWSSSPQVENQTHPHSSPLSHKSSIHSQFSGDTLHMTGNPSPQRKKRLKSFSSEETQKISRV